MVLFKVLALCSSCIHEDSSVFGPECVKAEVKSGSPLHSVAMGRDLGQQKLSNWFCVSPQLNSKYVWVDAPLKCVHQLGSVVLSKLGSLSRIQFTLIIWRCSIKQTKWHKIHRCFDDQSAIYSEVTDGNEVKTGWKFSTAEQGRIIVSITKLWHGDED